MYFRSFLPLCFLFSFFSAFSQSRPFLQRALGGYGSEEAVAFVQTFDKGYAILSDNSYSAGGDIINDNITERYSWVVKVDSSQNILWRYNIHSNNIPELRVSLFPKNIIQTRDSGIVVIGESYATYWDSTTSWAIKFSKNGKLLWKYILPLSYTYYSFSEIKEAPDGSLVIAGAKNPNRSSISPTTIGWLVVLNSNGTLKWERNYIHNGLYQNLKFKTVDIIEDGLLIGGDKDDSFGMGRPDFYLFKTNFNGDSLWSKTYGGYGAEKLQDVLPLTDGYLLTGTADYDDRDVIGIHCVNGASYCFEDAWVLKLDKAGAITWQKTIGDVDRDIAGKLAQSGTNYLIVGSSTSGQYTPTKTKGGYDAWIMEFDKNGNVVTPRVFYGGPRDDYAVSMLMDVSGGKSYPVILSTTESESGGDVEGFHDNTSGSGESDIWIFKLGYFNTIKGNIFYDLNKNNVKETNEPLIKRGIVNVATASDSLLLYNTTGEYSINLEGANYTVSYHLNDSAFQIVPPSRKFQFSGYFTNQNADFALQLRPGVADISVSAISLSRARPGFQAIYEVSLLNRSGDTVRNKEFYFIKDNRTSFSSSTPAYSGIRGDTMILSYNNLKYSDTLRYTIVLNLSAPPVLEINDTLIHRISVPLLKDVDTTNNYVILKQLVRGSFDPNDKSESHEGVITPSQASKGEYMNYLIRFQNTGTDTAFTVIVRDTLDKALDMSSFEMIKASHPYTISIKNNILEWRFGNINLPDSNINEKGSHGFIAYKIRTRKNLVVNSSIYNSASIYFDYNLPIKTNTTKTLIFDGKPATTPGNSNAGYMTLVPNPTPGNVAIHIKSNQTAEGKIVVYDMVGRRMLLKEAGTLEKDRDYVFSVPLPLPAGIYNVAVYLGKNKIVQKLVVQSN